MRQILIDAMELKKILPKFILEEAEAYIDETEEIEAIPIEWIDGYIKRRVNDAEIYAEILFISDMVTEWEKENAEVSD